jgi:hypothetical protein
MVTYTIVNAVTFLLGVLFLLSGYRLVKRGREDIALFVMSSAIGIGLIIVAVYPNIFTFIAAILGLELKARAILVISNLTLFVIITYLFNRIGHLYDKISVLNEEMSLLRTTVNEQREIQSVDKPSNQDDD